MAFTIRNLGVYAYANGVTLWTYKQFPDTLEAITTSEYFNDATDALSRGDTILVSAADGGAMLYVSRADSDGVVVQVMSRTPAPAKEAA